MAGVVVALSKFVLGRKPVVDEPGRLQRKHLRSALKGLEKRYKDRQEMTDATLHPSGRCTCAGEGSCEWCKTHCIECGMERDGDGLCPHCDDAARCAGCARAEQFCECEVAPEEPSVDYERVGLDPEKWNPVIADNGEVIAALPEDTPEEMKDEMTMKIIGVWCDWSVKKG
jgi:hypothetical protein